MLSNNDKQLIKECGQEYLMEIVLDSQSIKEQTSFLEHLKLCSFIKKLTYEDVVKLTITEAVTDFESKFRKFLKYSFAAIAGASFFGLAPPISMFALYIYRKLNDGCERKCYANIPFTAKRKICKYQCQLDIARKITDDLRSDIGRCDEFRNPDKCEKKLRKEYMKWAQRVQQLQVKLRQTNLSAQKDNRPEFKGAARRAEGMIKSLKLHPSEILKFITEDKKLRESISFRKHLLLYETFKEEVKKKTLK